MSNSREPSDLDMGRPRTPADVERIRAALGRSPGVNIVTSQPDRPGAFPVDFLPPEDTRVLIDVANERVRQDLKWGQQNHPDGTGPHLPYRPYQAVSMLAAANAARARCQANTPAGTDNWWDIWMEEIHEAGAASTEEELYTELIQAAAVNINWAASIRRRRTGGAA